jgi:hypothetical protein
MSHEVSNVISLRGWLGLQTEGKGGNPADDLKAISPDIVQCIDGNKDHHDACPSLPGTSAQVIGMPAGHHFDGDYDGIVTITPEGSLTVMVEPDCGTKIGASLPLRAASSSRPIPPNAVADGS